MLVSFYSSKIEPMLTQMTPEVAKH